MFKLTSVQAMHLPTLLWYLNQSRALGKTELLAYSYLFTAINNPNKSYQPIDFPEIDFRSRERLLERIVNLAENFGLEIQISKVNTSFKIKNVNPHLSEEIQKVMGL